MDDTDKKVQIYSNELEYFMLDEVTKEIFNSCKNLDEFQYLTELSEDFLWKNYYDAIKVSANRSLPENLSSRNREIYQNLTMRYIL